MKYLNGIIDSINRVPPIDPDATAFFNRVTAAGGSLTATEQTAIDTLVKSLKTNSLWTSMYAIYPMVGASAAACSQNLKSASYTGTFSGGWTYASTGVTPNGSNGYMNTNLNALSVLTASNMHLSVYSRSNTQVGSDIGMTDNIQYGYEITARHPNGNSYYENGSMTLAVSVTNSVGSYIGSTLATNNHSLYKNGSSIGNTTVFNLGTSLNGNMWLAAINNTTGAAYNYTNREQAYSSIGLGLSSTQAATYYTIIQTFQTTLSRQV